MAIHSSEKAYKCEVCWKGFMYIVTRLYTPVRKLTSVKFVGKSLHIYMISHKKWLHTLETNVSVIIVVNNLHKNNLKANKAIHTGKKPYICYSCGKQFSQICNLETQLDAQSSR